jgi:hypothetical protein
MQPNGLWSEWGRSVLRPPPLPEHRRLRYFGALTPSPRSAITESGPLTV